MSKLKDRIYLIGFMGSGKSSMGKELAKKMKFNFIDLDELIEEKTDEELQNIFKRSEEEFRKIEAQTLRELTFSNTIFALGGGTPCFHNNIDFINKNGVSVYLEVSEEELYERLQHHRKIRPLLSGKDHSELKNYISELLASRKDFYEKAKIKFNGANMTLDDLVEQIDQLR